MVSGLGRSQPGLLRLQVFDANAVLRPGEQLVTYASVGDRPYVPGVPVGVITRVQAGADSLTKGAYVRPFANDDTLGVVGVVIAPPRKNPGDSVLPTPPPPVPQPAPGLIGRLWQVAAQLRGQPGDQHRVLVPVLAGGQVFGPPGPRAHQRLHAHKRHAAPGGQLPATRHR